jgi:hypothetical protein
MLTTTRYIYIDILFCNRLSLRSEARKKRKSVEAMNALTLAAGQVQIRGRVLSTKISRRSNLSDTTLTIGSKMSLFNFGGTNETRTDTESRVWNTAVKNTLLLDAVTTVFL